MYPRGETGRSIIDLVLYFVRFYGFVLSFGIVTGDANISNCAQNVKGTSRPLCSQVPWHRFWCGGILVNEKIIGKIIVLLLGRFFILHQIVHVFGQYRMTSGYYRQIAEMSLGASFGVGGQ